MKSLKDFIINEYWGSDDDASQAYSESMHGKCLKRFVDWAKANKGIFEETEDIDNFAVGQTEIDGFKYVWFERGDMNNGWNNWILYTDDKSVRCIGDNSGFYSVGPSTAYSNVCKFDEWNSLFENLYQDYVQHPIDNDNFNHCRVEKYLKTLK